MEKHCTTVYFLLKKTRKDKNGDSPIDAWIAVNGERTSYSTGKKVKVSEWDEKKQLVKGSSDKAKLMNSYQAIRENQRRFSFWMFYRSCIHRHQDTPQRTLRNRRRRSYLD